MLTCKNLTNPIDISTSTLLCHAKDVEANAKKAYALCISEASPYKDFNGTFASGTNWETYIEWVRVEMFKILEGDKVYDVDEDDDPDSIPITVVDNDEEKKTMLSHMAGCLKVILLLLYGDTYQCLAEKNIRAPSCVQLKEMIKISKVVRGKN